MLPVQMMFYQGAMILRARNSELVILPEHISSLMDLNNRAEFSEYFMKTALVNRPARKLFEAWLKKDHSLWHRILSNVEQHKKSLSEEKSNDNSELS